MTFFEAYVEMKKGKTIQNKDPFGRTMYLKCSDAALSRIQRKNLRRGDFYYPSYISQYDLNATDWEVVE